MTLILASKSAGRSAILRNAGIEHHCEAARIDERAVEAPIAASGASPADIAQMLAIAKAGDVSARHPGALVLGADQTLSLGEEILHKSADMDDARAKLLRLQGQTHQLNSGWALLRDGRQIALGVEIAHMTMRKLTPAQVGHYLAACGQDALSSVGCYQIEGRGIQLFDSFDGDHFTIIGLPLMPILSVLRAQGELS